MAADRYQVIFSGRMLPGKDPTQVRQRVGQMFRIAGPQLERLFSGAPVVIKKDIDLDTATRFRDAFEGAGALVELKKLGAEPDTAAMRVPTAATRGESEREPIPPPPANPQGLELAPARTGSLIDCASREQPTPIPDISGIHLAEPGAAVASSTPEPSVPTPDISGIELAEPGARIGDEQPVPPLQVHIGELALSPAKTGSLEGYAPKVPLIPIPSTDHLQVAEPGKGRE